MKEWTAQNQRDLDHIMLERRLGLPNAHTGPFEKTTRCAKHQVMCYDCGEFAAGIIWKDDVRNSDTWFYLTCDRCDAELCADCIDTNDDGDAICYTCIEAQLHKINRSTTP